MTQRSETGQNLWLCGTAHDQACAAVVDNGRAKRRQPSATEESSEEASGTPSFLFSSLTKRLCLEPYPIGSLLSATFPNARQQWI